MSKLDEKYKLCISSTIAKFWNVGTIWLLFHKKKLVNDSKVTQKDEYFAKEKCIKIG